MNSLEDALKDAGTTKESRWHQCPRCSFWFDCLTEPSFANRPDEVPPETTGPLPIDIKKEIVETPEDPLSDLNIFSHEFGDHTESHASRPDEIPSDATDQAVIDIKKEIGFTMDMDVWANLTKPQNTVDNMEENNTYPNDFEQIATHLNTMAAIANQDSLKIQNNPPELKKKVRKGKKKGAKEKAVSQRKSSPGNMSNEQSVDNPEVKFELKEKDMVKGGMPRVVIAPQTKKEKKKGIGAPPKIYSCPKCPKMFRQMKHLRFHIEGHNDATTPCAHCGKLFKGKLTMERHVKAIHLNTQTWKCDKCDKTYKTKPELKRHAVNHEENRERNHVCHICSKAFFTRVSLTMHITGVHNPKQQTFICDQCPKAFKRNQQLKAHVFAVHTNERPFKCHICTNSYKSKGHLNIHINAQHGTGQKFLCPECGQEFKYNDGLRTHMRYRHNENLVLQCCDVPDCEAKFRDKAGLRKHKNNVHGQLLCEECKITFPTQQEFKVHMRVHAGKEVFHCQVCQKAFHHKYLLVKHMKSHGESAVSLSDSQSGQSIRRHPVSGNLCFGSQ